MDVPDPEFSALADPVAKCEAAKSYHLGAYDYLQKIEQALSICKTIIGCFAFIQLVIGFGYLNIYFVISSAAFFGIWLGLYFCIKLIGHYAEKAYELHWDLDERAQKLWHEKFEIPTLPDE